MRKRRRPSYPRLKHEGNKKRPCGIKNPGSDGIRMGRKIPNSFTGLLFKGECTITSPSLIIGKGSDWRCMKKWNRNSKSTFRTFFESLRATKIRPFDLLCITFQKSLQ